MPVFQSASKILSSEVLLCFMSPVHLPGSPTQESTRVGNHTGAVYSKVQDTRGLPPVSSVSFLRVTLEELKESCPFHHRVWPGGWGKLLVLTSVSHEREETEVLVHLLDLFWALKYTILRISHCQTSVFPKITFKIMSNSSSVQTPRPSRGFEGP